MKTILTLLVCLISLAAFAQEWTDAQLDEADTAGDIEYLTDEEKDAIQYINLARLYPQQFKANELDEYFSPGQAGQTKRPSKYFKSLQKALASQQSMPALQFDKPMYELAACFAKESGEIGAVTHKRKSCSYGYRGECCSYGMHTGKDIAMQWLIDDGIKNLAHRINCLSRDFTVIGLAVRPHKVYKICSVADFR